jgi:hypothetical protein
VLAASRRTVGWVLPAIWLASSPIEGLFGVPPDVAATCIVLFTLSPPTLGAAAYWRFAADTRGLWGCGQPSPPASRVGYPPARGPTNREVGVRRGFGASAAGVGLGRVRRGPHPNPNGWVG